MLFDSIGREEIGGRKRFSVWTIGLIFFLIVCAYLLQNGFVLGKYPDELVQNGVAKVFLSVGIWSQRVRRAFLQDVSGELNGEK
ncbi:hypothetical protein J2S49_000820 [Arcanobacterium wilhelmae]|uniref:Uncharacterized protein n=1 Tax=Arcanobacterium wilhelmae TaxID=1803177 RepID=A0ABT9NAJ2_9ACTO|nr:hypothetical protein [Arcanobacterium wilhelmae]MDP9800744.1 hypothetical protein [Arcanobacterium wilhelmae]WFN90142.1 hypothetical protein P8A24_08115 [Arcanobacterium wilhelmae]